MVLDLLDQFTNTRVLSLFHNKMWQSRYSDVDVNLDQLWLLVTLRVTCVTAHNGFHRCIMICFGFNVEVRAFMSGTCLEGTLRVTCVTANNGCLLSIMFHSFFMKRTCFDLLGTGRFSCTLRVTYVTANNKFPRSVIMIWVWIWLVWLGIFKFLNNLSIWSLSNFWTQFFHPVVFQGDLWWRPRLHIYFLVYDFSSFHPNNYRDTISWECFMKNDSVRSCLIELQFFLQSKIDVDPIHRILMLLPCFMHVLCMTRFFQVDRIRIPMVFVHGIYRQKEYGLPVVQILTSRYQSWICDGV